MGTFEALRVGERFTSPPRAIDDDLVASLIETGAYTHPLFTDPAFAASSRFGGTPVPGEGVLLLMGGLIEQSGRFDDTTIALLGLDEVVFAAPLLAGAMIEVEAEVLGKDLHPNGARGTITFRWTCRDLAGTDLVVAVARMLFRV